MPDPNPFPDSLCPRCQHCRRVETARSMFLMCQALPNKYPRQPVLECASFSPSPPAASPPPRS